MAAGGARAAGRADAAHRLCLARLPRTIRNIRPAWRRSCRRWGSRAGPIGRNVRIDYRVGDGQRRRNSPTCGGIGCARSRMSSLLRATRRRGADAAGTRTVPIVFTIVTDPVGAGFVDEPGAAGRQRHRFRALRIQLEREMAGAAERDRAGRDARGGPAGSALIRPESGNCGVSRPWRHSLRVEVNPVNVRDAAEIERAVTAFASSANGGLLVTAGARWRSGSSRADRHACGPAQLPAVYPNRVFVASGGLMSYGPDFVRPISARGRLCRSHPQGREASRPAGAGADQVRAGDQSQDRQGARPRTCRSPFSPAPTR